MKQCHDTPSMVETSSKNLCIESSLMFIVGLQLHPPVSKLLCISTEEERKGKCLCLRINQKGFQLCLFLTKSSMIGTC